MHKLFQNGGKWCNSNSTTNENGNFKSVPVLMTLSEWSIEVELGIGLSTKVSWIVVVPEVVGPRSNGTNVKTEVLLVRGRADSEGVELSWVQCSTGNLQPLASLVIKCHRSLEVHTHNQRGQDLGTNNSHLGLSSTDTDEQINSVYNSRSEEEVAKERVLHKTSRAVKEGENVEHHIPVVSDPEGTEGVASCVLSSKHKDDDHKHSGKEPCKSCHGQEKPVGELGQNVSAMVDLSEEARQIVGSLSADVVEVEAVADGMHEGKEQSCKGHNLVERDVGIEGNVVVEDGLTEIRDKVTSHGEQQHRVGEHHSCSSSSSYSDPMTSDSPESSVLSLYSIIMASLDKDHDTEPEVNGQIENVDLVVFNITNKDSPLSSKPRL